MNINQRKMVSLRRFGFKGRRRDDRMGENLLDESVPLRSVYDTCPLSGAQFVTGNTYIIATLNGRTIYVVTLDVDGHVVTFYSMFMRYRIRSIRMLSTSVALLLTEKSGDEMGPLIEIDLSGRDSFFRQANLR